MRQVNEKRSFRRQVVYRNPLLANRYKGGTKIPAGSGAGFGCRLMVVLPCRYFEYTVLLKTNKVIVFFSVCIYPALVCW